MPDSSLPLPGVLAALRNGTNQPSPYNPGMLMPSQMETVKQTLIALGKGTATHGGYDRFVPSASPEAPDISGGKPTLLGAIAQAIGTVAGEHLQSLYDTATYPFHHAYPPMFSDQDDPRTQAAIGNALQIAGQTALSPASAMAPRGSLGSGMTSVLEGSPLKRLSGPEPSTAGYVYHATSEDRARDIAEEGSLNLHNPGDYTDQDAWPDGSTQKRNYFTSNAQNTWQFAPEDGKPVLLRIPSEGHPFKKESGTGDLYSTKPVPADKIEALDENNQWVPLRPVERTGGAP
jgi:hypothetical protein